MNKSKTAMLVGGVGLAAAGTFAMKRVRSRRQPAVADSFDDTMPDETMTAAEPEQPIPDMGTGEEPPKPEALSA